MQVREVRPRDSFLFSCFRFLAKPCPPPGLSQEAHVPRLLARLALLSSTAAQLTVTPSGENVPPSKTEAAASPSLLTLSPCLILVLCFTLSDDLPQHLLIQPSVYLTPALHQNVSPEDARRGHSIAGGQGNARCTWSTWSVCRMSE